MNELKGILNHNGELISADSYCLHPSNRAFKYGDGIFDTLKVESGKVWFAEDHYFRLMSSMRMIRMKIPRQLTLDYYESQVLKTASANGLENAARVRVNVFRKEGGLYSPRSQEVDVLIEASPLSPAYPGSYEIELFKDFSVLAGLLSTVKTNNRLVNVLAGIFARENSYQNSVLLNERKEVVEASNANIFLIRGRELITPTLESGCIHGIVRKKLLEGLRGQDQWHVVEARVSPFDLLKADEVFLTNSIQEIQSVHRYRKKTYDTKRTGELIALWENRIKTRIN